MQSELNPRGLKRPKDGRGGGTGLTGGRRLNRNTGGCSAGGPGHGDGGGRGRNRNRNRKK